MNYIQDINLINNDNYNMIVEIPKGTNKKYELVEPECDRVECVRKVIGKYPFDYGCFPQTLAGDGDALDVILLSLRRHKSLDIVKITPVAIIKTIDDDKQDDKVIAITSNEFVSNDFIKKLCNKTIKFLKKYKGKKSKMILDTTLYGADEAIKAIEDCHNRYNKSSTSPIKVTF